MSEIVVNHENIKKSAKFFKDAALAVANTPCDISTLEYKEIIVAKIIDDCIDYMCEKGVNQHLDVINRKLGKVSGIKAKKVERVREDARRKILEQGEETLRQLREGEGDHVVESPSVESPFEHIDLDLPNMDLSDLSDAIRKDDTPRMEEHHIDYDTVKKIMNRTNERAKTVKKFAKKRRSSKKGPKRKTKKP